MKSQIQIAETSFFTRFEKFFGQTLFHGGDWETSVTNNLFVKVLSDKENTESIYHPTSSPESRFYGFSKNSKLSDFLKMLVYTKYGLLPNKYSVVGVSWSQEDYDHKTQSNLFCWNYCYYITPSSKVTSQNFRDFSALTIEVMPLSGYVRVFNTELEIDDYYYMNEIKEFWEACKKTVLVRTSTSVEQGEDGWQINQNFFIETEDCNFLQSLSDNNFAGMNIKQTFNIEEDKEVQNVSMTIKDSTTFDKFIDHWWSGIIFDYKVKFENCKKSSMKDFMKAIGRVAWT